MLAFEFRRSKVILYYYSSSLQVYKDRPKYEPTCRSFLRDGRSSWSNFGSEGLILRPLSESELILSVTTSRPQVSADIESERLVDIGLHVPQPCSRIGVFPHKCLVVALPRSNYLCCVGSSSNIQV